MTDKDLLHRFIFEKTPIRGEYIHLHDTFLTIVNQHDYPPPLRQLLGEALCAAGLLSAIIKFDGRVTIQFRGKGKLRLLLAQCDNQFQLRGLAKWDGDLSYDALMDAFHDGILVVMLDSGASKKRYQGVVAWRGNSLTESLEGYFRDSEQLATKIWLGVNEKEAAGFLLQVTPSKNKEVETIDQTVVNPYWNLITSRTSLLQSEDILGVDYQVLLRHLYPEEEIRIFPSVPVKFHCACSRRRGEDAIYLLGREEVEEELKDKQTIVVTCDFCNSEYLFDRVDVTKIFEGHDRPPAGTQLH